MLKKYVKRFSQSMMSGLAAAGPTSTVTVSTSPDGKTKTTVHKITMGNDEVDSVAPEYRWPPASRKVIDDEVDDHQAEDHPRSGRYLDAKEHRYVRRPHLSSCSSTTTTATTTTGEEGFGSEPSLDEANTIKSRGMASSLPREGMLSPVNAQLLVRKPSNCSTNSSLSSCSEGLSEMIAQLRCTLFYYPLVFPRLLLIL